MTRWLVLQCEHDSGMDQKPCVMGVYKKQETATAKAMFEMATTIEDSGGDIVEAGYLAVASYDESGAPGYGCTWTVCSVDIGED